MQRHLLNLGDRPAVFGQAAASYNILRYFGSIILIKQINRLIWVMMTGNRPSSLMHIDHIDGNPTNNRWNNLRLCEPQQNARNSKTPKNNSSGYKGVAKSLNKFRAFIVVNRRQIHLGTFNTPEEASAAYQKAAIEKFGEFACINR
jgi:hypothetical protein